MTPEASNSIRPDFLAAKMAEYAKRSDGDPLNKSLPRLRETMVFLFRMSQQPGGLGGFAEMLIREFPEYFRTKGMAKIAAGLGTNLDLAGCLRLWKEMDNEGQCRGMHRPKRNDDEDFDGISTEPRKEYFNTWLDCYVSPSLTPADVAAGRDCDPSVIRRGVKEFNFDRFQQNCLDRAYSDLAGWLRDVCQGSLLCEKAPSYCPELFELLSRIMDRHAESVRNAVVLTDLARKVLSEVEFVWRERESAQYLGDPRLGKTISLETCAAMYPGRFLYVRVPPSNDMQSFIAAHAKAIGIDTHKSLMRLKEEVEAFIVNSGVAVLYDEWHNAWPRRFSENTMPERLDWVRCQLIDQGVGCAFLSTTQSYQCASDRYLRKTRYAQEQWTGRVGQPILLNEVPTEEDLVAIARLRFPDADQSGAREMASICIESQQYLELLPRLGHRARFISQGHGSTKITAAHVRESAKVYGLAVTVDAAPSKATLELPVGKNRCGVAATTSQTSGRQVAVTVLD